MSRSFKYACVFGVIAAVLVGCLFWQSVLSGARTINSLQPHMSYEDALAEAAEIRVRFTLLLHPHSNPSRPAHTRPDLDALEQMLEQSGFTLQVASSSSIDEPFMSPMRTRTGLLTANGGQLAQASFSSPAINQYVFAQQSEQDFWVVNSSNTGYTYYLRTDWATALNDRSPASEQTVVVSEAPYQNEAGDHVFVGVLVNGDLWEADVRWKNLPSWVPSPGM